MKSTKSGTVDAGHTGYHSHVVKTYATGSGQFVTVPESDRMPELTEDLLSAAKRLLARIENMTSDEFSRGAEKAEREALRSAIKAMESAQ